VWVLQHGDQLLAALSRYNQRTLSWPSHDEEEKVNFLVNLADREMIRDWVLFPTGDQGAALVARHHKTLGNTFNLRPRHGMCCNGAMTSDSPISLPTK